MMDLIPSGQALMVAIAKLYLDVHTEFDFSGSLPLRLPDPVRKTSASGVLKWGLTQMPIPTNKIFRYFLKVTCGNRPRAMGSHMGIRKADVFGDMARLSTSALHQLTDAKLLAAQANEGPTMENLTRDLKYLHTGFPNILKLSVTFIRESLAINPHPSEVVVEQLIAIFSSFSDCGLTGKGAVEWEKPEGISLAFFIDPPPPTPLKSLYNVQTVEHEDEEEEKETHLSSIDLSKMSREELCGLFEIMKDKMAVMFKNLAAKNKLLADHSRELAAQHEQYRALVETKEVEAHFYHDEITGLAGDRKEEYITNQQKISELNEMVGMMSQVLSYCTLKNVVPTAGNQLGGYVPGEGVQASLPQQMAPLAILGAQSGGANAVYENAISGGSSMKRRVYQSEQVSEDSDYESEGAPHHFDNHHYHHGTHPSHFS